MPPVLLVHGMWGTKARMEPLRAGLSARGIEGVIAIDLSHNDGRLPITTLAREVSAVAEALATASDGKVDIVGFSMGALISRVMIQRAGGRAFVRKFVSLSGPHAGTATAWAGLPLAGVRDMRPGSALVRALRLDEDPWGPVDVHCVYTPYDLMVLPAKTAILPGARTVTSIPVKMHRWMITDARVHDHVARLLRDEAPILDQ